MSPWCITIQSVQLITISGASQTWGVTFSLSGRFWPSSPWFKRKQTYSQDGSPGYGPMIWFCKNGSCSAQVIGHYKVTGPSKVLISVLSHWALHWLCLVKWHSANRIDSHATISSRAIFWVKNTHKIYNMVINKWMYRAAITMVIALANLYLLLNTLWSNWGSQRIPPS